MLMGVLVKRTGFEKYRTQGKSRPIRAIKNHIRYISAQKEKHRNEVKLFDQNRDEVDRKEIYEKLKNQRQHGTVAHKIVFSLSEDEAEKNNVDMIELVRETMDQYQAKYKQQFTWVGALHDDEGHPHVHVVILGRDKNDKAVGIYTRHMRQMERMAEKVKERMKERPRDFQREFDLEREEERFFEKIIERNREITRDR
jgi:diadenosine tetraphosphate (Ap4A) HIT family hydrolase